MARIYLHGLGQTPDSWKKTIERVNDDGKSLCPDLAKLLRGKKACYEVLYGAFTEICEGQEKSLIYAACPWAAYWRCIMPLRIRKR